MTTEAPTGPAQLHVVEDGPPEAPVLVLGPSLGTDLGLFDAQVGPSPVGHRVIRYDLRGSRPLPRRPRPVHRRGHGGRRRRGTGRARDRPLQLRRGLPRRRDRSAAGGHRAGPGGPPRRHGVSRPVPRSTVVEDPGRPGPGGGHRVPGPLTHRRVGDPRPSPSRGPTRPSGCWPCSAVRRPRATRHAARRSTGASTCATGCGRSPPPPWSSPAPTIRRPPDVVRGIADGIPDARFVVVPQASHLVNAEQPDAVTAEIRAFLG